MTSTASIRAHQAEARSGKSALHMAGLIMDTQKALGKVKECTIVCEIQDPRTQDIIKRQSSARTHIHYFRANKLVAALIAMVSQQSARGMRDALVRLLRYEEPNLCILPIDHEALGLRDSLPLRSTYAAMASHVRRLTGAVVVGCADADERQTSEQVQLNPPDKNVEREWVEGDRLIVLSTLGERHGPQQLMSRTQTTL